MNTQQESISVAFVLVLVGLTVKHGWLGKSLNWAHTPGGFKAPESPLGGNITDWQAALVAYAILILMAESPNVGQVAVPIAWAVGLIEFAAALPTLQTHFPGTFAGGQPMDANATPPPMPAPGTNG